MNIQSRLAKLEEASGINRPCRWCGGWAEDRREQLTFLDQQAAPLHRPTPADLKPGNCIECGRATVYDLTFLTPEDRALSARLMAEGDAAEREGRPVSREWWQAFLGLFDREQAAMRVHYGETFDPSLQRTELPRFRRWMEEQMNAAACGSDEHSNEIDPTGKLQAARN
jgi:hypothetical protein